MNEIEKRQKNQQDYVEAEIVDDANNRSWKYKKPHQESFLRELSSKIKKIIFFISFGISFALIVLGSLLSATVIGAIIGIPLIILGLIVLFLGFNFYAGFFKFKIRR